MLDEQLKGIAESNASTGGRKLKVTDHFGKIVYQETIKAKEQLITDAAASTVYQLTVPPVSHEIDRAVIQVKPNNTFLASVIAGDAGDKLIATQLLLIKKDGNNPVVATRDGEEVPMYGFIVLDNLEEIQNLRFLSTTDSVAAGSDIRPLLHVTYYIK